MEGSAGLYIQNLRSDTERVLILANLAGLRNEDGWFEVRNVTELLGELRIPPPSNVSATLSRLKDQKLLLKRVQRPPWSLTPNGQKRSLELMEELDYEQLQVELQGTQGADFSRVHHTVIPPFFAPPRWASAIERLLTRSPFETNVFCMTRFPDDKVDPDHISPVIEALREALFHHGLTLHLASDGQLDDELFGNIGAYMWACQYGIILLEERTLKGLNYNALIEVGAMLITGRRCAILLDEKVPKPPTDLIGHIYKRVDFDDLDKVKTSIHEWIIKDLGLPSCRECG